MSLVKVPTTKAYLLPNVRVKIEDNSKFCRQAIAKRLKIQLQKIKIGFFH